MAKRVAPRLEGLKLPVHVIDIFSVSGCISTNFVDYIPYWKHNGYWFFDSPEIIRSVAAENSIQLEGTSLFYYEAYEKEFNGEHWQDYLPDASFRTNVEPPSRRQLEGFDVVTFWARTSPECSPLSCNSMAAQLRVNAHCLFASVDEAAGSLNDGAFKDSEPGPYRIFAVFSVDWP